MIVVFGGTTEGRMAVNTLDSAGSAFFYSTRDAAQEVDMHNGSRLCGAMDAGQIASFCREEGIRLIVDAAHPFAAGLHKEIATAAAATGLPVVRYERRYPEPDAGCVMCRDYDDAIKRILGSGARKILVLTGVQTIGKLRGLWSERRCIVRILDRDSSRDIVHNEGFPQEDVRYYHPAETDSLTAIEHPDAILTKESGESGEFRQKMAAAKEAGIPLYVVARPQLPDGFITVDGPEGLRKEVEKRVPGFYPLRSGFTTGACATAATKAAALLLTEKKCSSRISITLPSGEHINLPVATARLQESTACAEVIKDGGDDPDATHGCRVCVRISRRADNEIKIRGGEGIGKVTLPGLGLPVGEWAINPVPRKMMAQAVREAGLKGADIEVSIPGGERIALQTFNSRVGVIGGVSVIGTSGIVRPFSNEAFMTAIEREIDVACAVGSSIIVLNSGARSEKMVKSFYPGLHPSAFIHYGNAIGEALKACVRKEVAEVAVGLMLGKAVKLAEGHLDTHSHKVSMNTKFLASLAAIAGCSTEAQTRLRSIKLARTIPDELSATDNALFFPKLAERCHATLSTLTDTTRLTVILLSDSGELLARNPRFA